MNTLIYVGGGASNSVEVRNTLAELHAIAMRDSWSGEVVVRTPMLQWSYYRGVVSR